MGKIVDQDLRQKLFSMIDSDFECYELQCLRKQGMRDIVGIKLKRLLDEGYIKKGLRGTYTLKISDIDKDPSLSDGTEDSYGKLALKAAIAICLKTFTEIKNPTCVKSETTTENVPEQEGITSLEIAKTILQELFMEKTLFTKVPSTEETSFNLTEVSINGNFDCTINFLENCIPLITKDATALKKALSKADDRLTNNYLQLLVNLKTKGFPLTAIGVNSYAKVNDSKELELPSITFSYKDLSVVEENDYPRENELTVSKKQDWDERVTKLIKDYFSNPKYKIYVDLNSHYSNKEKKDFFVTYDISVGSSLKELSKLVYDFPNEDMEEKLPFTSVNIRNLLVDPIKEITPYIFNVSFYSKELESFKGIKHNNKFLKILKAFLPLSISQRQTYKKYKRNKSLSKEIAWKGPLSN